MTRARVIFAGTPEFSVPCLDAVHRAADVVAVYCQPDRPAGRGRQPRACAVKQRAKTLSLPVLQPASLRDDPVVDELVGLAADLMVVVAYGQLLPARVLAAPRHGCVNVHASLLPRWRGAAPIQRAIAAGDPLTGVTLMQMDRGLDTGAMLARASTAITEDDTGGTLHDRLAKIGAALLDRHLPALLDGRLHGETQDEAAATYAAKLNVAEATIDWRDDAGDIARRIRAFDPWPACRSQLDDTVIRLFDAVALDATTTAPPGTVLAADDGGVDIACGEGVVRVRQLQRSGGRRLAAAEFLRGARLAAGARLQ